MKHVKAAALTVALAGFSLDSIAFSHANQNTSAPATTQPVELSIQEIILRVKKTYAECKSYRDKGELKITRPALREPETTFTVKRPFTTAFVRGDRMRIEVKHPFFASDAYLLVIAPTTISLHVNGEVMTVEKNKMASPISSALAGMASEVSWPFAYNVPNLLLGQEADASMLEQLKNCARKPNERVDDADCLVLAGETAKGEPMQCWVDSTSFMIRRLHFSEKGRQGETIVADIAFAPELNAAIDPKELEFNPPALEPAKPVQPIPKGEIPPPLTKEQIDKMDAAELRDALRSVSAARRNNRDPQVGARLKQEFDWLMARLRERSDG